MLEIILIIISIALDQFSKYLVVLKLKPVQDIPLIDGVFHLYYTENQGAAFGILQGQIWIFLIVLSLALIFMAWFLIKHRNEPLFFRIGIAFIIGGGIGNAIDRIRVGYVVDMFYFKLINFAIFNVADIFAVVGTIMVIVFLLFFSHKSKYLTELDNRPKSQGLLKDSISRNKNSQRKEE